MVGFMKSDINVISIHSHCDQNLHDRNKNRRLRLQLIDMRQSAPTGVASHHERSATSAAKVRNAE
jgi:hypothetical protein